MSDLRDLTCEDERPDAVATQNGKGAALQESETRFRAVAQSAVDAIISIDVDDGIIFWNKAAERMFGYTEKEMAGKPVVELMPTRLRHVHRHGLKKYIESGQPHIIGKTVELRALRRDGTEFPIELSLSTWMEGGRTFFTGIIRDISRRKQAEDALQQRTEEASRKTQELESLIQMVAHDLKSPVLTINGLVRVLRRNLGSDRCDVSCEEILAQITASGVFLEMFLRDLLDGLAVEGVQLKLEPIYMESVAAAVVAQHVTTAREKGISVELDVSSPVPPVMGDRRRLSQVLDNLLTNAIRYMGEIQDPRVTVHISDASGFVRTEVSDNSIGIPAEFRDKIFDRFFRVQASAGPRGTGLGLYIVKKIVEGLGGKVWVESEEGRGSTFSFTVPKADPGIDRTLV